QASGGDIRLVAVQHGLGELGGLAKTQGQHAGRQRIKRAGMASLGRTIQALDLLQNPVGGNALGLIDHQDAIYIAAFASSAQASRSGLSETGSSLSSRGTAGLSPTASRIRRSILRL